VLLGDLPPAEAHWRRLQLRGAGDLKIAHRNTQAS
jgi:hypothetical protein